MGLFSKIKTPVAIGLVVTGGVLTGVSAALVGIGSTMTFTTSIKVEDVLKSVNTNTDNLPREFAEANVGITQGVGSTNYKSELKIKVNYNSKDYAPKEFTDIIARIDQNISIVVLKSFKDYQQDLEKQTQGISYLDYVTLKKAEGINLEKLIKNSNSEIRTEQYKQRKKLPDAFIKAEAMMISGAVFLSIFILVLAFGITSFIVSRNKSLERRIAVR